MRINESITGCLMYWHLLDRVPVEWGTMSLLSADDHGVCSVMICQLGCSLSAHLYHVNSAVICQLSSIARCQLSCTMSAQMKLVISAASCWLSSRSSLELTSCSWADSWVDKLQLCWQTTANRQTYRSWALQTQSLLHAAELTKGHI